MVGGKEVAFTWREGVVYIKDMEVEVRRWSKGDVVSVHAWLW